MDEIQIFNNIEFGQIRTVQIDGATWFVGNDVANALGYKRAADAVAAHCKGSVKHRYLTGGGYQELKIIPEGDIYRLVARSKLPTAEKFESWVFDDVLPTIRQTGAYRPAINGKELLALAVLEAQRTIGQKDRQIEEMAPKARFADAVATSYTSILISDLAKLIKQNGVEIGPVRLFEWMRENGYLIKRKGADWNTPTQRSMELGVMEIKESTINTPDGNVRISKTPKITGKGQQYFIDKFLRQ